MPLHFRGHHRHDASKSFRMALARWPDDQIYLHVYLHINKIGINVESRFHLGLLPPPSVLASDESGPTRPLLTCILLCIQLEANNEKQTIWYSRIKFCCLPLHTYGTGLTRFRQLLSLFMIHNPYQELLYSGHFSHYTVSVYFRCHFQF